MELISMPFRDLPIGSRFKYTKNATKVFIVIDQFGSGLVAEKFNVTRSRVLQGIYSAFPTEQDRLIGEVWAIND